MSKPTKTGYRRTHDFAPYTRADGQAVSDEFDAVQAHLDRLPELREDGLGFKVSPVVPDPTADNHPVPFHLLKSAERSVYTAKDSVERLAQQVSTQHRTTVENTQSVLQAKTQATQSQQAASQSARQAIDANEQAQQAKSTAQEHAQLATLAIRQVQQSASQASQSESLAQKWAANPEDSVVQNGKFSALHYATKAKWYQQTASEVATTATQANAQAQLAKTQVQQSQQRTMVAESQATSAAQTATEKAEILSTLEQAVTTLHNETQRNASRAESAKEMALSAQSSAQQSAELAQQAASQARNIAGGRKEWRDIDNVPISSSINDSSTQKLANTLAVKTAYDKAVEAKNSADAAQQTAANAQQAASQARQAADSANSNASNKVSKTGDAMTGNLEIDRADSYVRGKVGHTNKWYVGKGSSSSDDITLWSNAYNSGVTLKSDRTEVTKPLYVGNQKVFLDEYLIASIAFFAIDTAPSGWLKANGAAVSRTTYAALFAKIGTTFGSGDGRTTFNLPDLRGEFIRGWDDGRRIDALRRLGSSQSDAIKTHKIRVVDSNSQGNNLGIFYYGDRGGAGNHTHNELTYNGADETRPRNIALLACIKY